MQTAQIYVRNGRAYLPAQVRAETGIGWLDVAPVLVSELQPQKLSECLERLLMQSRVVDSMTEEQCYKSEQDHPLLKIAGAESWKDFERDTVSFNIAWREDATELSVVNSATRPFRDEIEVRVFPPTVPSHTVVGEILNYLESHTAPELFHMGKVYVRQGKAYLPTLGKTMAGHFARYKPVYTSDLTMKSLGEVLNKVLLAGSLLLPYGVNGPGRRPYLLHAAGVKMVKEFRKNLIYFTCAWRHDITRLYIADLDRERVHGPLAPIDFDAGISPHLVGEAILEYLMKGGGTNTNKEYVR